MLQADYGWLFARIARMPETRSTRLAHLPAGTYATSTRASRQGLSCKGGRFHASDDYVYYELGGALPPRKHPSVNSFGMVTLGAPSAETHERVAARRAPPLQGRHARGAPRTSSDSRGYPEATSQGVPARPSVRRAARSSTDEKRAV